MSNIGDRVVTTGYTASQIVRSERIGDHAAAMRIRDELVERIGTFADGAELTYHTPDTTLRVPDIDDAVRIWADWYDVHIAASELARSLSIAWRKHGDVGVRRAGKDRVTGYSMESIDADSAAVPTRYIDRDARVFAKAVKIALGAA